MWINIPSTQCVRIFWIKSVATRKIQSLHQILFISRGKRKYRENPKRVIIATMNRFRSRLCNGKVLTPLTSIVLDRNHLGCLCLIGCRYLNVYLLKFYEVTMRFLLVCLPMIWVLVPTYAHLLKWEIRAS